MSILPISFDSYIGYSSMAAVEKDAGGISDDSVMNSRVLTIGRAIASRTQKLPWSFKVINSDQINAFALPGGPVYVNKGLLDMSTDDELAQVMGHEMAHVTGRDGIRQMEQQLGTGIIEKAATALLKKSSGLNLSDNELNIISGINSVLGNLILLGYSRDDEYDADAKGLDYMYNSGYNSAGAITIMQKLAAGSRDISKLEEYLSTHPATAERIARLQHLVDTKYPPKAAGGFMATIKTLWAKPGVRYGAYAVAGLVAAWGIYKIVKGSRVHKFTGSIKRNPEIPTEKTIGAGKAMMEMLSSTVTGEPTPIIQRIMDGKIKVNIQRPAQLRQLNAIWRRHFRGTTRKFNSDGYLVYKRTGDYIVAKSALLINPPIPKELESLAKEARKYKSAEEFAQILKETRDRVLSLAEKLHLVLGHPVFGYQDIERVVPELRNKGIPTTRDITGGVDVIRLDDDLTSYLKHRPMILADFYTKATKG